MKVTIEVPDHRAAELEDLMRRAALGLRLRIWHSGMDRLEGVPFRFVPDDEVPADRSIMTP